MLRNSLLLSATIVAMYSTTSLAANIASCGNFFAKRGKAVSQNRMPISIIINPKLTVARIITLFEINPQARTIKFEDLARVFEVPPSAYITLKGVIENTLFFSMRNPSEVKFNSAYERLYTLYREQLKSELLDPKAVPGRALAEINTHRDNLSAVEYRELLTELSAFPKIRESQAYKKTVELQVLSLPVAEFTAEVRQNLLETSVNNWQNVVKRNKEFKEISPEKAEIYLEENKKSILVALPKQTTQKRPTKKQVDFLKAVERDVALIEAALPASNVQVLEWYKTNAVGLRLLKVIVASASQALNRKEGNSFLEAAENYNKKMKKYGLLTMDRPKGVELVEMDAQTLKERKVDVYLKRLSESEPYSFSRVPQKSLPSHVRDIMYFWFGKEDSYAKVLEEPMTAKQALDVVEAMMESRLWSEANVIMPYFAKFKIVKGSRVITQRLIDILDKISKPYLDSREEPSRHVTTRLVIFYKNIFASELGEFPTVTRIYIRDLQLANQVETLAFMGDVFASKEQFANLFEPIVKQNDLFKSEGQYQNFILTIFEKIGTIKFSDLVYNANKENSPLERRAIELIDRSTGVLLSLANYGSNFENGIVHLLVNFMSEIVKDNGKYENIPFRVTLTKIMYSAAITHHDSREKKSDPSLIHNYAEFLAHQIIRVNFSAMPDKAYKKLHDAVSDLKIDEKSSDEELQKFLELMIGAQQAALFEGANSSGTLFVEYFRTAIVQLYHLYVKSEKENLGIFQSSEELQALELNVFNSVAEIAQKSYREDFPLYNASVEGYLRSQIAPMGIRSEMKTVNTQVIESVAQLFGATEVVLETMLNNSSNPMIIPLAHLFVNNKTDNPAYRSLTESFNKSEAAQEFVQEYEKLVNKGLNP